MRISNPARRSAVLAAPALSLLLAACGGGPVSFPGGFSPPDSPTPVAVHVTSRGAGGFTVVRQMKGVRTIYSIRALSFEGRTLAEGGGVANGVFEAPHVVFRGRDGSETVADAPKAELSSADKSVVMTGGVEARTQDGNVLRCDRLRYDGGSERIHGEGRVRLVTPSGLILTGDRIDGDVRLADVRVTRKR